MSQKNTLKAKAARRMARTEKQRPVTSRERIVWRKPSSKYCPEAAYVKGANSGYMRRVRS